MNVVYYSSDFFSEMCGVALQSLCENNQDADSITIYIVEDNISVENKKRLAEITKNFNRKLEFIRMPSQAEIYPEVKINLGRTYARMALADILPKKVDRVLSLDSDTLVFASLNDMYHIEFGEDEYVGGVFDCVGKAIQSGILHASDKMKYCNAGMFLIDLKKWRELDVGKQLLNVVTQNADGKHTMYFLEQDMMNLVFDGHVKLLHPRYNMLTSVCMFDYEEILRMKKPVLYYTKSEVLEAKMQPALIHATTCFYVQKRMWVEKSDHPFARFYQDYRNKTGWKKEPQVQDSRKKAKKLYAKFWHCMPRSMAVRLAAILINYIRPSYARFTVKINLPTIAEQSVT